MGNGSRIGLIIIVLILFLIDFTMTYINVRMYRKKYPRRDYTELERNQIIVSFWKKYGFEKGSIIAFSGLMIGFSLMVLFVNYFIPEMLFVALGMWFLTDYNHLDTFIRLKKLFRKKK